MQKSHMQNCKVHSQSNDYYSVNSLIRNSTIQFACKQCLSQYKLDSQDYQPYNVQDFPMIDGYSMSFPNLPSVNLTQEPGVRMDFMNSQIEHILFNPKASGYLPKSLTFIPEKNMLVAADKSGRIDLWYIGEKVEYLNHILVGQAIQIIKYINIGKDKKYLLVVCSDQIYVLDMEAEEFSVQKTLCCGRDICDLIFIPHREQIISLQSSMSATIWSLKDWERVQDIDLKMYGVRDEVYSGAYMKEDDALMVEDTEGICLINLNKLIGFDGKTTALKFRTEKQEAGMCYLPVAKQFMLRTTSDQTYLVDVKNFTPRMCYEMFSINTKGGAFDYIVNQNESQILCNSNFQHYYVYHQDKCSVFNIKNLVEYTGAIAAIPHQNRFVIADSSCGKLIIFRTNTANSFRYNQFNLNSTIVRAMPPPIAKPFEFKITPIPVPCFNIGKNLRVRPIKKDIATKPAKSKTQKVNAPKISKTKSRFNKDHPTSAILENKKKERVTRSAVKFGVKSSAEMNNMSWVKSGKQKTAKASPKKVEKIILIRRISKKNKSLQEEVGIVFE